MRTRVRGVVRLSEASAEGRAVVTREDQIEQSCQEFVKAKMIAAGYNVTVGDDDSGDVVMLDAFPFARFEGDLEQTYVATGFNFDDGGKAAEMGSDLKTRLYTFTFYVFGSEADWGKNVANVVKAALEDEATIPLRDYGISDPAQIIDYLILESATTQRQFVADPRPWQENIWTTVAKLRDEYYAGAQIP